MIPSDRQLVLSSFSQTSKAEIAQYQREEEIKRSYSIQNQLLAKKNGELQSRVSNLENQLFQTQRQVLLLKNEKIQLTEKLKLNSKRFNDIIVDSFDNMMSEYRSFMVDVGIDVEKKNIPINLSQKVKDENYEEKATNFEHYWQNINNDLQRRKSFIFQKNISQIDSSQPPIEETVDEEQLDTLVETIDEEEKEEEVNLEPEYEDKSSINIPVKKKSSISMEKLENFQLSDIPFLGISVQPEVPFVGQQDNVPEFGDAPDDYYHDALSEPIENSPVKAKNHIEVALETYNEDKRKDKEDNLQKKITRRKSSVPRELKNLDTEKTKKWTGMDPLDDTEESASERRKSRRRSLVVNYQMPSLNQNMRRTSGKFHDVYIDEDKENRVSKPKSKMNRNILRNITNTNSNNRNIQTVNKDGKKIEEKSIFDIENTDIFGEYHSQKRRNRNEVYDLLL